LSALPKFAPPLALLNWVAAHPDLPFDPSMVVSLRTTHTDDWEWQAVEAQMEQLKLDGYITKLRVDQSGTTFWGITASGERYRKALIGFEDERAIADSYPSGDNDGATMESIGGWQKLKALGEGGQSRVFLVRRRSRVDERGKVVDEVLRSNPWAPYLGGNRQRKLNGSIAWLIRL
jgi:hypothetical protein